MDHLRTRLGAFSAAALLLLSTAACSDADNTEKASSVTSGPATKTIVAAANAFLGKLSGSEKSSVLFARDDKAQKQRWSDLPEGLFERKGLMVGNLDQAKVDAFLAVMKATLSAEGYARVMAEWAADDALAGSENGGGGQGMRYGKKYYWIGIIGEPSESAPWQWQFGGHHVTVNATIKGDDLSLTPSFIGAQPTNYAANGDAVRPLGDIEDAAFAFVNSLNDADKSKAVLGGTPIDLVLGPGQECRTIRSEGLPGSGMEAEQQESLIRLINLYAGLANDEDVVARQAQLRADLPNTHFAWYGPTTAGTAAYFRVTGPHLVIEYSPQSMGGDAVEHIHGVYRDPTNDYGGTVCS
ncbi:hypothetical protein Val02_57760 [Virgisporangium aliadipatigenens]|uniref:DUF3500 domain-containing protein n=1 Tax=Virgisporangium aliadipatigenens TaxID=741659 RepID=A0A8J3YS64_9ACTN|nr:DUF3500 domain-containing protein [Virgisporangium aliadipatigenens]GIJ48890.1 hypothetical protein Val02_57760 [Virgisporangium aliadipatigenens]